MAWPASYMPALIVITFNGILGPAGMSDAVVTKLNAEIMRVVKLPEVQPRLVTEGAASRPNTPADF